MTKYTLRRGVVFVTAPLAAAVLSISPAAGASADENGNRIKVTELATFVQEPCPGDVCTSGSTIGPDGALYVTDGTGGRIQRIDRTSGAVTTFADGLPDVIPEAGGGGGVSDIAFQGSTAYVLVSGTSKFWTDLSHSPKAPVAEGIYRLDRVGSGTTQSTLVANIYAWSVRHPPKSPNFFVPGGYTYAMEPYRDGFLVTDGHHNRVLRVRLDGTIRTFYDFGRNIVPTGLELDGPDVLVGRAGPVPHVPDAGRVVALTRSGERLGLVASGAPLLVDVELGRRQALYGLAQGFWPYAGEPGKEGFPAAPHTGMLMRADRHGQFQVVAFHLDRPQSFELVGGAAFVVTLTGKVLKVTGLE